MISAIQQRFVPIDSANRQRSGESRDSFYCRLLQEHETKSGSRLNGMWGSASSLYQPSLPQQVRMAPQVQDAFSQAGGSYEERLAELKKLHENTDYSGMEPKDISRLLCQRFQEAFPNYWAINGGLYLCAGENSIYEQVWKEESRQFNEAANGALIEYPNDPEERTKHNRYTAGYDEDISDEELLAKLQEKYSGGTLADRCGMVMEMMHVHLLDAHTGDAILMQIRNEQVQRTEGQYGRLYRDNPIRVNAMIAVGENTAVGWTQLVKNTYTERENWRYESEEVKRQMLNELEEGLNHFLEYLGLPRTDLKR